MGDTRDIKARQKPRHNTDGQKAQEIDMTTQIKSLTAIIYSARKSRTTNPEGRFDSAGRWYPSDREDLEGDGSSVRSPSRAWPYSYMLRCRTRQHCRALVEACLAGLEVPVDVARAVSAIAA